MALPHPALHRIQAPATAVYSCLTVMPLHVQAWIVYADITAATAALRGMHDFPFFDKPLVRHAAACLARCCACCMLAVWFGGCW